MPRSIFLLGLLLLPLHHLWGQDNSALMGADGNVYSLATQEYGVYVFSSYSPATGASPTLNSDLPPSSLCLVAPNGTFLALADGSILPEIMQLTAVGVASTFATFPTGTEDNINLIGCPVMANDGNYYGGSGTGGAYGYGYLYQLTSAGAIHDIYDFTETFDGTAPSGLGLQASDGNLYFYSDSYLLRYNATDGLSVTSTSGQGFGGLIEASDHNFYGLVGIYSEINGDGFELQRLTPTGNLTTIYTGYQYYDNNMVAGPFLQGDGNFGIEESTPDGTNACYDSASYLSFYSVGLDGQAGTQAAQIGEGYNENYNAFPIFLNGNGSYYGTQLTTYTTYDGELSECNSTVSSFPLNVTPAPLPTPPIAIAFNNTHIIPGGSSVLSWKVNNAYSDTMQQCYGYGGAPGSMAALGKVALTGSMPVKLTTAENYQASLVCGGTEANIASVTAGNAAVTVSASATAVPVGASVTLTGRITNVGTPAPTGSIKFYSGTLLIGSGTLNSSGVAKLTASTAGIAPGSYSVAASYAGDANYGAAASSAITITVVAKSATTLSLNPTSQTAVKGGANPTFTVTAKGNTSGEQPTGNVSFLMGSTVLATVALEQGAPSSTASFSPSVTSVPPGTYTISASYAGDSWNNGSTSNSVRITVLADSVTVTASPNPVPASMAFTLTATAAGSVTPTGTVVFYAGSTGLGSNTLSDGTANITVSAGTLSAGSYSVTAHYAGDKNNPAVTSAPITLTVQ